MKKLSVVFSALAILLSDVMCAVVAYNYSALQHSFTSFPADVAFLSAIPYGLAIAVCVVLAVVFKKKAEKQAN